MSRRRVKYTKCLSLIIGLLLGGVSCFSVQAQEGNSKAVVFLMDVSGSMNTNDPERLAVDSIAQLIFSLPSDYKVGFVAYNGAIAAASDLVDEDHRDEIIHIAETVKYSGYSNAGEGLASAVAALEKDGAHEKSIVILSDGEILMNGEVATQEAATLYQTAIEQAKEAGIAIYVIGLGDEMKDSDNAIFYAADKTQGQSYYIEQVQQIQSAIDAILTEQLKIKQSTVAIVDADGGLETVSVDLPYAYADKIRILLTSSAPIQNMTASFHAGNATQINGVRYSLIEIEELSEKHLELHFEGAQGSQVRVNVIPEYWVYPQAEVVYEDSIPLTEDMGGEEGDSSVESSLYYDRTAQLWFSFCRESNHNIPLWNEEYFNYSPITAMIDGDLQELILQSGSLVWSETVTDQRVCEVIFDYSALPVNVIGADRLSVTLDAPPLLPVEEPQEAVYPQEHDYQLIGILITCVFLVLVGILALVLYLRRPKSSSPPTEDRPEPGKYSYVGKIKLYVTRTRSGYDIPPLSYNLFRLPSGKVISLLEILTECEVEEQFPGAENIYFKAGAARSLILTNNSDCTIIKNREILMKKKSYSLNPDAKVDVSFEDEISELTLQYKV